MPLARVLGLVALLGTPVAAQVQGSDPLAPSLSLMAMKDGAVTLTPQVKVGERFQVVVTVTHEPDVVVGMPATFDTGVFEVLERRESSREPASERTFQLTVVAWQPGRQIFPPVPVTYVPKGQGELKQVATGGLEVDVLGVLPAAEDQAIELRPIAGPVAVYVKDWRPVIAAGAAGATFLAGSAILLAIRSARRRKARRRAAEPVVDLRPAHEIALGKLRALASSPLLDEPDPKPFYFAMTEVVREYLGRRYGFSAMDMTSRELLEALASARTEGVERWLGGCDLVKFARLPVDREDALVALEGAMDLVEESIPAPVETAAEPRASVAR